MYSIIIVEDEAEQREVLNIMIHSINEDICIYEANSEMEALQILQKNEIDIFLIDIFLKESSGLVLAKKIRSIPKYEFSQIIFLTTHVDYMLQAFKQTHCYDYILKPYDKDAVHAMLRSLISNEANKVKSENLKEKAEENFLIKISNGIYIKVKVNDIMFVEVIGRNCDIHTINGLYTYCNISLKKILNLINCEYIVQSHKAFVVNINHIFKVEKVDAKLSNLYFNNYSKVALLGYKFKNNIIPQLKSR